MSKININHIIRVLSHTKDARIAVFGDYCLDKYLYSDPENDEKSAETGDNAFRIHRKVMMAGVGGTIANNLRSLGAQVICIGIIGEDGEGFELMRALKNIGADTSFMVRTDRLCTCTYQKVERKQENGAYEEWKRFDFRNFCEPPREIQEQLLQNLKDVLDRVDGVIITDQFYQRNQGTLTDWLRERLSELAAQRRDKIFYADSRSFADEYHNMIVKCNNLELFALTEEVPVDPADLSEIIRAGQENEKKQNCEMMVTCGSKGLVVFGGNPVHVPGFHVEGPMDIVGAGDAANAGFVLGLCLGLDRIEAGRLACCVSSITIQQLHTTGTATVAQVTERLKESPEPV